MLVSLIVVFCVFGGIAIEIYSYWFYYTHRDRNMPLTLAVFFSTQIVAFVMIGGSILLHNYAQSAPPPGPRSGQARGPVTPPRPPTDDVAFDAAREAVLENTLQPAPPRFHDQVEIYPIDTSRNRYRVEGTLTVPGFAGDVTQRYAVDIDFTHAGDFRKTTRVVIDDRTIFDNP